MPLDAERGREKERGKDELRANSTLSYMLIPSPISLTSPIKERQCASSGIREAYRRARRKKREKMECSWRQMKDEMACTLTHPKQAKRVNKKRKKRREKNR